MTKKDYELIASALNATMPDPEWFAEMAAWRLARDKIADELQGDNPQFDRARFIAATEQ